MIVESRVQRGLVDSEYNLRRQQCEAAARHAGVPALRDLDEASLARHAAGLDAVTLRRARHVVSENARTLAAAQALAAGDWAELGALMAASHASMRDDFEITVPAIDRLVAILQSVIGTQGGARMDGRWLWRLRRRPDARAFGARRAGSRANPIPQPRRRAWAHSPVPSRCGRWYARLILFVTPAP